MNEREFRKICDYIYRKTGIAIEDRKFQILGKKIENLMQKEGYDNFRTFFHDIRFAKDNSLFQNLINTVTVNETYFYRENYQFESLIQHVFPELHSTRPKEEPIRVLCAPSSTGEEPYSVALHLLNEGRLVEERDFEIIGIDIDSAALEKAKTGIFSKRSIQFVPRNVLSKYFTKLDENRYKIADFLIDAITFQAVNVMDKFEFKRLGKIDIIFSRNMLIYFDEKSRKEVAMTFYESLKPNGYVFLGHAESMNRIVSVFKSVKVNNSIIYKKHK